MLRSAKYSSESISRSQAGVKVKGKLRVYRHFYTQINRTSDLIHAADDTR